MCLPPVLPANAKTGSLSFLRLLGRGGAYYIYMGIMALPQNQQLIKTPGLAVENTFCVQCILYSFLAILANHKKLVPETGHDHVKKSFGPLMEQSVNTKHNLSPVQFPDFAGFRTASLPQPAEQMSLQIGRGHAAPLASRRYAQMSRFPIC